MHQRWKTFRETCSTHVFFQVGEKNALKPAKKWWLGVAPRSAIQSSIYLIDVGEKWQILVEVIFDPSKCLENMNKQQETTWHIPKPHQGPKEHQNQALRSNFMNLEVTMSLKLGHFLTFFLNFFQYWYPMVLWVPPVRYFDGQVCSYRFLGQLGTKY